MMTPSWPVQMLASARERGVMRRMIARGERGERGPQGQPYAALLPLLRRRLAEAEAWEAEQWRSWHAWWWGREYRDGGADLRRRMAALAGDA